MNAIAAQSPRRRLLQKFMRHRLGVTGLAILAIYLAVALLAPWIAPFDPDDVNLRNVAKGPSAVHWLGTDQFGRDILTRVMIGAQTSLLLGACVVVIATGFGLLLGVPAGYFRGWVERVIMFCTDVLMTMPSIITALAVITVLGPGLVSTIFAIAIAAAPRLVRVARSAVLQVRELDYIDNARTLGAGNAWIMARHVLPNSLAPIIVQSSLLMAETVLVAAGLGFLGLGVPPPTAEWGQMLAEGRGHLRAAPFISIFPGLAIAFLVLGFNLLGDGLRDTLDVRTR
ncbi:ABC transporter permease [Humitalea sp. 24SJ18S-53]|uniref:ABC transporter permease n=1 Tax=Humitalea sp. 24SJ18S-53 TaxID=3422307 RepID=UPI003D677C3A